MISPAKLFMISSTLTKDKMMHNKYTYMGYTYKYPHYRILKLGDLLSNKIKPDVDIPKYVYDFVGTNGEVLIIANIVDKHVPMIQLRTIRGDKAFSVFGKQTTIFYGLGMISKDFKYGDWLILCEGIMDTDILRSIYPNVLGCMTSGLTKMQLEILKLLTNKVIICYDNDKAGRSAYTRDSKILKSNKFDVKCLIQYGDYKDAGDLGETMYNQDDFAFNVAFKYYKTKIDSLISNN